MKNILISILLLTAFIVKAQDCPGNYITNGDFENIEGIQLLNPPNNIEEAAAWTPIWESTIQNPAFEGEVFPYYGGGGSGLIPPSPISGNYGGFWVTNNGGEREGIMTELGTSIPVSNSIYDLNFDLAVLHGHGGATVMAIYGAYNPSSVLPIANANTPLNLDLFGPGNTVLLGTLAITGAIDGSKQKVSICINAAYLPTNGITHVFFTRTEATNGGQRYVGVDNFCLTEIEALCAASMQIESSKNTLIETPCGSFVVPRLCGEGQIRIESNHCPVKRYRLSIWEWDPATCTKGALAYTTGLQPSPLPTSFDIWNLFTPSPGTVYWVDWGIQQTLCHNWDYDSGLFRIDDDCCTQDPELELEAWISDVAVGSQLVTSQTYGWSKDVPFLCELDEIYNFLTNTPCVDVYKITNSTFNTNTWTNINTLYTATGANALPLGIALNSTQCVQNVVNHLHIEIASPYQNINILWIPGCDPEIELPTFDEDHQRTQESTSTGINKLTKIGFSVFPNPTEDKVTVKLEDSQSGTISIASVVGKELYTRTFKSQVEIDLDLSEFAAGVYFINVNTNGQIVTRKVIKE